MLNRKHAIATLGSLLADPGRSAMLMSLLDDRSLSAGELARAAGVSPQSASAHLAKLASGGLITVRDEGRCRYYKLSNSKVAYALEALGAISTISAPAKSMRPKVDEQMMLARSCYDHMAGRIAVLLAERLEEKRMLATAGRGDYKVTTRGREWFADLGIDVKQPTYKPAGLRSPLPGLDGATSSSCRRCGIGAAGSFSARGMGRPGWRESRLACDPQRRGEFCSTGIEGE